MFTVATECGGRAPARAAFTPMADSLLEPVPVPGREELQAIAEDLASRSRLWSRRIAIGTRQWDLLAVSAKFEAWVIGWPPGGTIALHDHGDSAGAVVVAEGELVETLVAERTDSSVTTTSRRMVAGMSWTMGPRHIHDIVNDADSPAVSVHVYAPRLTSMTQYRLEDGILTAAQTVRYRLGAVLP